MSDDPRSQQVFLSRLNARQVLEVIRTQGPSSRADVARASGLSAPTVSKAASALLAEGFVEETDAVGPPVGRPAKMLRLAREASQVVGIVIDVDQSWVVATGLDGDLVEDRTRRVETPANYDDLIEALAAEALALMARPGAKTLGLGLSVPGRINPNNGRQLRSPHFGLVDGRKPGRDLAERLGLDCAVFQEQHALCLAEQHFGQARGVDNFALIDLGTGVGLGIVSGGQIVNGHSGSAGEVGHVMVDCGENGAACWCGNRGCLETVAGEAAIAARVSRRIGRKVAIREVVDLVRAGELDPADDLNQAIRSLAIGLAAVINLFNPSTLFLRGVYFDADESLFPRLLDETRRRTLGTSLADCSVVRALSCKRQGAVAGVIQSLMDGLVPDRV